MYYIILFSINIICHEVFNLKQIKNNLKIILVLIDHIFYILITNYIIGRYVFKNYNTYAIVVYGAQYLYAHNSIIIATVY